MEEHPQARQIVETLAKAGFIAYYAGGWVRDFLLQHPSDDIDIATNAPPETIQALFSRTVPIGIAFGIILVIIDDRQYEVATFRQDLDYKDGRRPSRVAFSTAAEDAKRRDFTINGMFYDPLKEEVLDFVEGKADLQAGIIRAIGNPHERIREDRLRMIRAVRLACRFRFQIEAETEKAIRAHAKELFPAVAIERIVQELEKAHAFGSLRPTLIQLHDFGLLAPLFPTLASLSLAEIVSRLEPTQHYPSEAPLIAHLLPLLPPSSQTSLCQRLKLSSRDQEFVLFLHRAQQLPSSAEPFEWAHFYAHPLASLTLQILGCHLDEPTRFAFYQTHETRLTSLQPSIDRIRSKNPVITSKELLAAGISPGKTMGLLLREAERISINEQIFEPTTLLKRLKQLPIWP